MTEPRGTLFLKHTQVIVHWADGRQEVFRLGEVTRIGRGRNGNDIAVPDIFQSVSRQHMEIRHEKDGYRLIDLESRNGVLVNNVYIKDTYLKDGDEIRIGQDALGQEIRILFQLGSESLLQELKVEEHVTIPPAAGLASDAPAGKPYFKIRWQNGTTNYFPILKDRIVIGRGAEADLRLPETLHFVSSQHAEVLNTNAGFVIHDLNSTNGTLLNNQFLQPDQFHPLGSESIIRIGDEEYGISVGITFINPTAETKSMDGFLQSAPATQLNKIKLMLIGRLPTSDLMLDHPEVSRRHALVREADGKYFVEDLDSSNGTYVNDKAIKRAELNEGDLIQISKFLLLFQDGQLTPYQSSGVRLDVRNLSKDGKTKNGKRLVLDRVSFTVLPREFIALIGGDGSGKSALLEALLGIHRGDGEVRLNGSDFYRHYASLRSGLGYVPGSDILHGSLTVENALEYTARLRLPSSLTLDERTTRIDTALDTVSINTQAIRRTRISDLSDGQRKRLYIAAELLADPKLIYLDDTVLGLDPGLQKKMIHTLRRMADEGRTVVLLTQAANHTAPMDHVAFLSEGRLVYFGPSEEALSFFEVEDFADIYERIDGRGEEWCKVFEEKKPEQYKKYVQDRQKNLSSTSKRRLSGINFGIADFFRQVWVLTQRSFNVLVSERIVLSLMLLLFPVTAILQLLIATPDVLTGNLSILADPVTAAKTLIESYTPLPHTNTFISLMGFEAMLAGLFLPATNLIKERSIFLHERMVSLKVLPYLLSKVLLSTGFVIMQVLLYLIIVSFGVDFPEKGVYANGAIEFFISLFLTVMAGISVGLLISAGSKSTEMAMSVTLIVLLFQFFFAGTMIDLRDSKLENLSYLTTTRWSLTALGSTIHMNQIAESTILCSNENPTGLNSEPKTVCFHYPDAKEDLQLQYGDKQLAASWVMLMGMTLLFLTVTWFLLRRADSG